MTKALQMCCPALGLAALVAWGRPSVRQQPDAPRLYGELCAACHGAKGAGDGPAATALKPPPAAFTDSAFQATRTDQQLTAIISGGKPPMPAFGQQLSAAQVKALVQYIRGFGKPSKRRSSS